MIQTFATGFGRISIVLSREIRRSTCTLESPPPSFHNLDSKILTFSACHIRTIWLPHIRPSVTYMYYRSDWDGSTKFFRSSNICTPRGKSEGWSHGVSRKTSQHYSAMDDSIFISDDLRRTQDRRLDNHQAFRCSCALYAFRVSLPTFAVSRGCTFGTRSG